MSGASDHVASIRKCLRDGMDVSAFYPHHDLHLVVLRLQLQPNGTCETRSRGRSMALSQPSHAREDRVKSRKAFQGRQRKEREVEDGLSLFISIDPCSWYR